MEDCQDYQKLKEALLTAYAVVPEVYRKRFRNLTKQHSETFSEFGFRLPVQFRRSLDSENAYDNIEHLREVVQLEQFDTVLEPKLRSWLLDQKPKSLTEATKLADQHVEVHTASRPGQFVRNEKFQQPYRGTPPNGQQFHTDKPFSAASSSSASVQHKPTTTSSQPKPRDLTSNARPSVICHYCKKPGHLMANCYKRLGRLAGNSSEGTPVQLRQRL